MNKNVFNESDKLATQLGNLNPDFMIQDGNNMNHLAIFVNNLDFCDS